MTRCAQCGRPLSDPVSVARGYGPVCFKKIQQHKNKDVPEVDDMDMGDEIDLSLISCNLYEPINPDQEEDASCLTCALFDACRG